MPFVNIRVNVDLDQAGIQAVTDAGESPVAVLLCFGWLDRPSLPPTVLTD